MDPFFKGNSNLAKYKNSVYYADNALGCFIDWARQTDWWRNTLVIMVADHCSRVTAEMSIFSPEAFRIPMLWIGGALSKRGIRIDKNGSQEDIPVTLSGQLGLTQVFSFGKDLFADDASSFAFYVFNEGFGFVTDSSMVAYDHKLKKSVLREGKDPDYAEKSGKAFLQVLFDDYLKR